MEAEEVPLVVVVVNLLEEPRGAKRCDDGAGRDVSEAKLGGGRGDVTLILFKQE